jgi:kinesin family protein 11
MFVSEETWNQVMTEQELRQTELEEAKKQVEIVESQMLNLREEYDQSIALIKKKDMELRETKERLRDTVEELEVRVRELKVAIHALEEEEEALGRYTRKTKRNWMKWRVVCNKQHKRA